MAEYLDTEYSGNNGLVLFQVWADDVTNRLTRIVYKNDTQALAYANLTTPSDAGGTRLYVLASKTLLTEIKPSGAGPRLDKFTVEGGWPYDPVTQGEPGKGGGNLPRLPPEKEK